MDGVAMHSIFRAALRFALSRSGLMNTAQEQEGRDYSFK